MGWSAQYFTTIIIEGNTPQTGIFIYNGTPSLGTLIGSWTAAAGQDAFGNVYPAGINVTQGKLQGVSITSSTATVMNIMNSVISGSTLNANQINKGQILETTIIFDTGGGVLLGYTSTTTTVTQTANGNYNFTSPITGTGTVTCIGAGAGGDGGSSSFGGNGGGGGECAQEPNYPLVNSQVYNYTVGAGGASSSTGAGHGGDGTDTFFDVGGAGGGVYANAGDGNGTGGTGSTNSVHFNGGSAPNAGSNTGAASGANSANKTAAGNAGNAPSGATGGAAPTAQSGSGNGGAGGNSGANGSNGTGPGGGGGGAGKGGSGITTLQKTYTALYGASYYGPDATNGDPNGLRTTNVIYQGGETASGGAANGNQRSVYVFNSNQIASDFSGYTPTGCTVTIQNLHSWYSSGMTVEFDVGASPQKYPASAPSSWLGNQNKLATGTIAEGATHTYNLGSTVAGYFINNQTNFMGFGAFVAANEPYNLNYYGYFAPTPSMTITGQIGSGGSFTSGTGADGSVVITYVSSSALECAVSPQSGTDSNSNAYGAGYTGPVNVFNPNSSPTAVETWHDGTSFLTNGWAKQGFIRYKLVGYNMMLLQVQLNDNSATSGAFMTMPTGYVATQTQFPVLTMFANAAGTPGSAWLAQVSTGAGGAITVLNWAKQSKQFVGNLYISLD